MPRSLKVVAKPTTIPSTKPNTELVPPRGQIHCAKSVVDNSSSLGVRPNKGDSWWLMAAQSPLPHGGRFQLHLEWFQIVRIFRNVWDGWLNILGMGYNELPTRLTVFHSFFFWFHCSTVNSRFCGGLFGGLHARLAFKNP